MMVPTHEDIYSDEDDDFDCVESKSDPSWRHGSYMEEVYHRLSDDTYWFVSYRVSSDGETNELRDGHCNIQQVYPVTKTIKVTEYVSIKDVINDS